MNSSYRETLEGAVVGRLKPERIKAILQLLNQFLIGTKNRFVFPVNLTRRYIKKVIIFALNIIICIVFRIKQISVKLIQENQYLNPFHKKILFFLLAFGVILSNINEALAHHPFELIAKNNLSPTQGFISGLAHPILGLDHLLFLLSVGLVANLLKKNFIIIFILSGIIGTIIPLIISYQFPFSELIVSISLFVSALIVNKKLNVSIFIPMALFHGYVLGKPMIGSQPEVILTYLIGLILAEVLVLIIGIKLFRKFEHLKKFLVISLYFGAIFFTFGTVFGA